jgi:hypothetical protein
MTPRSNSLLLSEETWTLPTEFYSCWNARGLYNPLQFVLRLRPDIHRALNAAPSGLLSASQVSEEQVLAFSTFFHENIHWWQHVGSTTGFVLSLMYPAQSHLNHRYLKEILSELGPIKPLRNYHIQHSTSNNRRSDLDQKINIALNNWHDIEFYRWLVIDPKNIGDKVNDRYFESVGHSYSIALGAVLWLLSSTIDPELEIFPDPRKWESQAMHLRDSKVEGFYYGSPILLPPIGAKEIFEGQARFSQLQYLFFSSGKSINWEGFEKLGMLNGVYVTAFRHFLNIAELEQPSEFDDSTVGLFLLVCDISINPAECLIEELNNFEKLVDVHDPGLRFLQLCLAIKERQSQFLSSITDYSAEEYWKVSELLCTATGFTSPRTLIQRVVSWPEKHQRIVALLEEDNTFDFTLGNLPVRVFLARFIKYQIDKSNTPEFFCWPGVWMTTAKNNGITPSSALSLFNEHSALFLDKEDGDVYPRIIENRNEENIHTTFNNFYSWVVTYELTRQWLVGSGDFDYNFSWLTSKYSQSEVESWASSKFENAFGIPSKGFTIV